MPLARRVPKRGFKNPGRVDYQALNVGRLASAPAHTVVDRGWLKQSGMISRPGPIKLLGGGEIRVALTVKVDAASRAAVQAIEAAGGKVEVREREA